MPPSPCRLHCAYLRAQASFALRTCVEIVTWGCFLRTLLQSPSSCVVHASLFDEARGCAEISENPICVQRFAYMRRKVQRNKASALKTDQTVRAPRPRHSRELLMFSEKMSATCFTGPCIQTGHLVIVIPTFVQTPALVGRVLEAVTILLLKPRPATAMGGY